MRQRGWGEDRCCVGNTPYPHSCRLSELQNGTVQLDQGFVSSNEGAEPKGEAFNLIAQCSHIWVVAKRMSFPQRVAGLSLWGARPSGGSSDGIFKKPQWTDEESWNVQRYTWCSVMMMFCYGWSFMLHSVNVYHEVAAGKAWQNISKRGDSDAYDSRQNRSEIRS